MRPTFPGAVALRFAAALLVSVFLARPLEAQRPGADRPLLRDLDFRGVTAFDEDELQGSIATEPSRCRSLLYRFTLCPFTRSPLVYERNYLDRDELARDVLRLRVFYWRRGYRQAQVDTLVEGVDDDAVRVEFLVTEGEPVVVDTLALLGADAVLPMARQRERLALRQGEPLSLPALDSSLAQLREALWERGHADARLDTAVRVDTATRQATVVVGIDPRWVARVGTIRVSGLEQLEEQVVRNSLLIDEGDVFRRSALLRSQRNLYESSLFIRATIDAAGDDSVKNVVVNVREGDLQRVRLAGGFNTVDFLQVQGRYTHYNFLGGARRVTLSGTLGNLFASALENTPLFQSIELPENSFTDDRSPFLRPNWQASLEFQQRWFGDPRNTGTAAIFAHRRATPAVVIDRGQGISATFTREVAPRINVSGSHRFEITRVQAADVYFCVNFGVCDPPTIQSLSAAQRLSPLQLYATADRSDDPLMPTRGYVARVEAEHAASYTASDFRYNRLTAEASAYRPTRRGVLAARARVGWADALESSAAALDVGELSEGQILHPRKRFYSGGSRSVRGFGENQLGPRVLTIAPSALEEAGCTAPYLTCSTLNLVDEEGNALLSDDDFSSRPIGGAAVAEANVEYRHRLGADWVLAAFLDGAILTAGDNGLFSLDDNFMALTPGVGVRYLSPVGPIRVDLGYNPLISEDLPVLTEAEVDGALRIVQVGGALRADERPLRRYAPGAGKTGWRKLLSRFTLHLSIGEAF